MSATVLVALGDHYAVGVMTNRGDRLEGDMLTIRFEERGSRAYYCGEFRELREVLHGS